MNLTHYRQHVVMKNMDHHMKVARFAVLASHSTAVIDFIQMGSDSYFDQLNWIGILIFRVHLAWMTLSCGAFLSLRVVC